MRAAVRAGAQHVIFRGVATRNVRQISMGEVRVATIALAMLDELAPELQQRAGEGQRSFRAAGPESMPAVCPLHSFSIR